MSLSTSPTVRCPRCSAHVRAGSDWCTLCYSDLRPAPAVVAAVDAEPGSVPEPTAPRRGKHARGTQDESLTQPAATTDVDVLAAQMLAQLAVTESKNPLGPLASKVDTPAKRVALMVVGAVGVLAILVVLMLVAGALL